MPYQWSIYSREAIDPDLLRLSCGDTLVARLLVNRGVSSVESAKYFLSLADLVESDPFEIPDIDKALNRIKTAIDNKQTITIYGDYDVDGTTSVALLYRAFGMIGKQVDFYIPNRELEGYGINKEAILKIRTQKLTDLLISCDCGISNYVEVEYANSLGLDVIITDHHSIPERVPPSIANCNPKTLPATHPLHDLPGVGMAYKLAVLILNSYLDSIEAEKLSYSLLDLVALGIIADMAALRGENRLLATNGLKVLTQSSKPGLQALLKISGVSDQANSEHVGFGIAPRINASGRLSDAYNAVQLMITENKAEAEYLCVALDGENRKRQIICNEIVEQAMAIIENSPNPLADNVIAIAHEDWHPGVIGIVASRILEKFHLPVFVMSIQEEITKGSVRCINLEGLDIYEAMSQIQSETSLFVKFGGHRMAAGFSCKREDTQALICAIKKYFSSRLYGQNLIKQIKIDSALRLHELDSRFIERIETLSPYGIANPQPVFASGPLKIEKFKFLGTDSRHVKLYLTEAPRSKIYEAVIWNRGLEFQDYYDNSNGEITIAYTPKLNEFMGDTFIQLDIKDWQEPGLVAPEIFARFTKAASDSN